jgi:hypothetical protein
MIEGVFREKKFLWLLISGIPSLGSETQVSNSNSALLNASLPILSDDVGLTVRFGV